MNKETKIGLFVTITLVLLYVGFNYLKGVNFLLPSSKYYAIYNNVDQLAISDPILINGYAVGRVSSIKILQQENNKVFVELDIDSDIILGDSTTAILNADFLGNKSILLNIKNTTPLMKPYDTIQTEVAKGLFDTFTENAEPVANDIQTTLLKLNNVMDLLALNSTRLDTIFMHMASTPHLMNKMLVEGNVSFNNIAKSFVGTSDKLALTLDRLQPAVGNLNTVSKTLATLKIETQLIQLNELLTNLNTVVVKFDKKDNTIGKLMTEDLLYVNLTHTLSQLNTLITHFEDDPHYFLAPLGKKKKKQKKTP